MIKQSENSLSDNKQEIWKSQTTGVKLLFTYLIISSQINEEKRKENKKNNKEKIKKIQ